MLKASQVNSLETRGMNQLHVLVDLDENPAASLAIKVGDSMHQHMMEDNWSGGVIWGGKGSPR